MQNQKNNPEDIVEVINGRTITYKDDTHAYYVDGIQVPSVTQIVSAILPSPYQGIETQVLKQAADRGIALHKEIEDYEISGIEGQSIEFHHYKQMKRRYGIRPLHNEKLIIIERDNQVICAGRLDMIVQLEQMSGLGVSDIKRTYRIHQEHLKLQLNLYRIGYMQSYHEQIDFLVCLHLRKFVYDLIFVPIDEAYAYQALEQFYQLEKK
ncbi:MAG: hypothetical protein RBR75_02130 [Acholeplasmataceae bacterium]|nr:hypothetical protein [Acholeplasmataceae bacterium]